MKKYKYPWYIYVMGWVGTACIIIAYGLNTLGIIPSIGILYPSLNLVGAIFLGIRVYADRNWSDITLEVVFGFIAAVALVKYFFF